MIITRSHKAFSFICGLVLLASNAVGAEAPADLKKSVQSSVEKAVQAQNDDALVSKGYQMAKKKCPYTISSCVKDIVFRAESKAGGDILKAVVCPDKPEQGGCLTALAFARGGIRYALEEAYWEGKVIKEVGGDISALVTQYGVQTSADAKLATRYFYDLLNEAHKDCGSGFSLEYGSASHRADQRRARERKANHCAAEVAGLSAIAMLARDGVARKEAAEKIYDLLEDTYSSSAAGIVIPGAVASLAVVNTPRSFALIEKFLMDETIPSTAGDVLHAASISGVANGALRAASNLRGGNSRYLNRINESFQYVDSDEARRQGHRSTNIPSVQYPYRNLLEDVGRMLGEMSKSNQQALAVSKRIIAKAYYFKGNSAHKINRIRKVLNEK